MRFLLKKLPVAFMALTTLISINSCGEEIGLKNSAPVTTLKETQTAASTPPVYISVILPAPLPQQGQVNKPYSIGLVKLTIAQTGSTNVDTISITPGANGSIEAPLPLLVGNEYTISGFAYESADGSGPVRYKGSLGTGVIQQTTAQLTLHLAPAAPGSTILINNTYTSSLTSSGVTLAADITPSNNFTIAYFEWRPAGSAGYTQTRIQTLGSDEVSATLSESLTGLQIDTDYFFRVVALNSDETVYGEEFTFNTRMSSAILSWTPPVTNTDGTNLNDLMGYRVYHKDPSGNTKEYAILNSTLPQQSTTVTYTLTDLAPGTHFFSVTAYDFSGNESVHTPEVSKTFN